MEVETTDYLELTIQQKAGYDNVKRGRENGITTQSHTQTSLGKSRNPGKKESNATTKHIDKATTEDQSVTNLNEESVYHRIHQYDSDGGFDLSKAYLDRTRPLPSIPTIQEGTREDASFPRKQRSRCRLAIIINLLILVVCGALVGIIKITCYQNWLCGSNDTPTTAVPTTPPSTSTTGQPPEQACNVTILTNYSEPVNASCTVTVLNAQTVSFQSGNAEEATYSFQGDTLNITIRGIPVHMVRTIEDVKVIVNIPEANCSTAGLHQVIFSNGTGTTTFDIHITIIPDSLLCPCTRDTEIGRIGYIQCNSIPTTDVSITFQGSNLDVVLLEQTPLDNITKHMPLSLEGALLNVSISGSEALVRISFPIVKCTHEGTYVITIRNIRFATVLFVKDFPDTPTLGARYKDLGGLVEGHTGEIICQARVGCGPVPTMYRKVFDEYQPITASIESSNETNDLGRAYNVTLTINNIHMASINGSQYMCSYVDDGVTYQSDDYMALVVPGDYCLDRENCHKHHPYVCNKYIACAHSRPTEFQCISSDQHFYLPDGKCHGQCESQSVANCPPGK